MKILFLSQFYTPKLSGVPIVVKYLAEGLLRKGHDVAIATRKLPETETTDLIEGVKVFRFDLSVNRITRKYCGNIDEYINFVIGYRVDVIIMECVQCVTSDVLLKHIKNLGVPVILHAHGFSGWGYELFKWRGSLLHTLGGIANWFEFNKLYKSILPEAIRNMKATVSLSTADSSFSYLERMPTRHYVVGNAADDMFFRDITNNAILKYATPKYDEYYLSCAYYSVVKNQLDIIRQYFKSTTKASLVLVGSVKNDYYHSCKDLVTKLKYENPDKDVLLLTNVDRLDIPSIVKGAKLYLVGSRTEQFSISIIEAMSQGVPFISTNVGNASVLPGGITINSIHEMSGKINLLDTDETLYKELSDKGRRYAFEECRIDIAVSRFEKIIIDSLK